MYDQSDPKYVQIFQNGQNTFKNSKMTKNTLKPLK